MANHVDLIEANIRWKWCLLSISGNATIVRLRRNDFVKYLKMNVASLIGSDYDLVRVTAISYTPNVLVNASLHWTKETEPRIVKALGGLALHNDTLLDLSGEHFNLTDFFPASSLLSTKIVSPLEEGDAAAAAADPSRQMEAVVYLVIGLTVAFLLTASLIFAVCQCVSNRSKPSSSASTNGEAAKMTNSASLASEDAFRRRSYLQQSPMTEETISLDDFTPTSDRRPSQPQLIYTQEFNDGLGPLESYQYLLQKRPRNNGHHHGHQARPLSSPMSEIGFRQHHRPRPRPRPSSVLDEPYLLSPPPDFNCGYTSDVTSDLPRHWGHPRRPETPLVLSSFRRPTPEEIQRDVDIVFHNLGLSGIEAARQ